MKPVKLSQTQLKRFMSLVFLSGDVKLTLELNFDPKVQVDLVNNNFANCQNGDLSITSKGVSEINRLSNLAGVISQADQ